MKRLIFYLCGIVCLTLPPACSNEIHISRNLDEEVSIFPDYKEVTIPVNIAPLDFSVLNAGGSETVLRIEGGPTRIVVKGDDKYSSLNFPVIKSPARPIPYAAFAL